MSTGNIRKSITDVLLADLNTQSEKTIGEASRIVFESAAVRQCIILDAEVIDVLATGFEAGIGQSLGKDREAYKSFIKGKLVGASAKLPGRFKGRKYFLEIVSNLGLTFGVDIFYFNTTFKGIKTLNHRFNEEFVEKNLSLVAKKYDRKQAGDSINFDHGAGTATSALGGAAASMFLGKQAGISTKKLLDTAGENLAYIVDQKWKKATSSQKAVIEKRLYDLLANWQQIITKDGKINANFNIIAKPVLKEVNVGQSAEERKELETIEKAMQKTFRDLLTPEKYAELEGSSTLKEKAFKVAITSFTDEIKKKIPEAQIKLDGKLLSTSLKTSGKLSDKTKKSKGKRPSGSPSRSRGAKAKLQVGRETKTAGSPIALMSIINSRLPQTVVKNMGAPRLENRTGRFANSTRVTDIQTTRQGYPSIGYTYDREPYGVFESTSGTRFSSIERDPRQLIEGSIREIAAELAIGRFYTRRV